MSRREAAWHLGLSIRTLDAMIAGGVLTPVKLPTVGRTLLDRTDLDTVIDRAKENAQRA